MTVKLHNVKRNLPILEKCKATFTSLKNKPYLNRGFYSRAINILKKKISIFE